MGLNKISLEKSDKNRAVLSEMQSVTNLTRSRSQTLIAISANPIPILGN